MTSSLASEFQPPLRWLFPFFRAYSANSISSLAAFATVTVHPCAAQVSF